MPLRIQDLEGELMLDHRNSPGVPAEMLRQAGLPDTAGRGLFEAPVYTCGHCQAGVVVLVKPFGVREHRFLCSGCRKVLCDRCGEEKKRTGVCKPFEQRVDEYLKGV